MKRGLSYIVMAVFCGLCFSSCAKDELAAKAGGDGRAPVRLALSLSGNSSRTVDAPTADGNWDFTTPEQGTIVEGDVYVLVIDAVTQRLKYLVEDLRVINDYADQKPPSTFWQEAACSRAEPSPGLRAKMVEPMPVSFRPAPSTAA